MSDYDRNVAARGFGAGQAAVIDAGLRAYMIRIYNYMAAGVALTGVVSYFTYVNAAVTDASGKLISLTSFGQTIYGGAGMIVLFLGTLGIVFFLSFRINKLQASTALGLFMLYAALLGVMLSSIFLTFAGLTAWDTQKIKEMYSANDDGTVSGRKAVMGALTLYLDFINLFLFLLRFMGDRR